MFNLKKFKIISINNLPKCGQNDEILDYHKESSSISSDMLAYNDITGKLYLCETCDNKMSIFDVKTRTKLETINLNTSRDSYFIFAESNFHLIAGDKGDIENAHLIYNANEKNI